MYVTASSLASRSERNWSISSAQAVICSNLISVYFSDSPEANFLEIEFKEFSLDKENSALNRLISELKKETKLSGKNFQDEVKNFKNLQEKLVQNG